jgi:hypothetical protein
MELEIKATDIVEQIVVSTKRQLIIRFGNCGFKERNNSKMMQFISLFLDVEIMSQVLTQLSYSHFTTMLQLEKSGIKVAEYLTELSDLKLLKKNYVKNWN